MSNCSIGFFMDFYVQTHSSKSSNVSEIERLLSDTKLQFSRLTLNEGESNEKNISFDQDILYYGRNFEKILRKQSPFVSTIDEPSSLLFQLDTCVDNGIDQARYTAILNYLKDFSNCTSLPNSDGYPTTSNMVTDTLMDIGIDSCWKVYDSNGQRYCC